MDANEALLRSVVRVRKQTAEFGTAASQWTVDDVVRFR